MKKEIIRESKKCHLIVDIAFYLIICFIGATILDIKRLSEVNTLNYLYLIFYIIGFFAVLAYFANRRKEDYEFLYFGLINVYVGSFALIYSNFSNPHFIVGCALLIYTISNAFNKGIHANILECKNRIEVVSKLPIMLILMFFSVFMSIYFYKNICIDNEVLGYYFLAFGLISMLEPLLCIVLNNKKISKTILGEEVKKEEAKKEIKKVSKRVTKRPNKKIAK